MSTNMQRNLCKSIKSVGTSVMEGKRNSDLLCYYSNKMCNDTGRKDENCGVIDLLLCGEGQANFWKDLSKEVSGMKRTVNCSAYPAEESIVA